MGLLFIFNLIIKGLFLNHAPNSLSFQEIEILRFLKIAPSINDFSFRLINVFVGSCIDIILFYLIFKKTKNWLLSLSVSSTVGFSPWFIVLSRYLNPYLFPILIIVIILGFFPDNFFSLLITLLLLIAFRFLFISRDLLSIKFSLIIPNLIQLFDFRTLFFQGDPASPMLRIPLTGYFIYLDLLAFFAGIDYLFLTNTNKRLKNITNYILLIGLIFFIVFPSDLLMTERGELVFLWISIVAGLGYYYLFNTLKKKNVFLVYLSILILLINFLFTAELFINHFDKKNSSEWSYAEQSTVKYLISNPDISVYMTNQSDKLYRYWEFFKQKNMKASIITIDQMKKICHGTQIICIAKEEELNFFDIGKDDARERFGNFDGLPMYFVLPTK